MFGFGSFPIRRLRKHEKGAYFGSSTRSRTANKARKRKIALQKKARRLQRRLKKK
jgi:hypothetical protein